MAAAGGGLSITCVWFPMQISAVKFSVRPADYSLSLSHTTEFLYAPETFFLFIFCLSARRNDQLSSHPLGVLKWDRGGVGVAVVGGWKEAMIREGRRQNERRRWRGRRRIISIQMESDHVLNFSHHHCDNMSFFFFLSSSGLDSPSQNP